MVEVVKKTFALLILAAGCSAPESLPLSCPSPEDPFSESDVVTWGSENGLTCNLVPSNPKLLSVYPGSREVTIDRPWCEANPGACRFALWHELAHVSLGHTELSRENESEADCWAAQHAPEEAFQSGYCWFLSYQAPDDGLHASGPSRAEHVRTCRQGG